MRSTRQTEPRHCLVPVLLGCLLLLGPLAVVQAVAAQAPAASPDSADNEAGEQPSQAPLSKEHAEFLELVGALISDEEREYFLSLDQDYRRDAFIEEFWRVRDPDPESRYNELRRRWEAFADEARLEFGFEDERSLVFMLNGPPGRFQLADGRVVGRCFVKSEEMEVWFYNESLRSSRRFAIILLRPGQRSGYRVWEPGMSMNAVQRSSLPTTDLRQLCGDELLPLALRMIRESIDYHGLLADITSPPEPPEEWLATFAAQTSEVPPGAETFPAELTINFPGRNQNRTTVQAIVGVDAGAVEPLELAESSGYHFQVFGEVVRDGKLFETFRYRYEIDAAQVSDTIPLIFSRYLRPGPAHLMLRVHDVFGNRYTRLEREIEVPEPEGLRAETPAADLEVLRVLREANEAAARGERILRILPPPEGEVQVGMTRFATQAVGDFDEVTFYLDDSSILTKRKPPFSVELDLGSIPATRRLRVVGYEGGAEVAADELRLNQGGQRFRVHITEPRADRTYEQSATVMVQVETPDEQELSELEIYLEEERIATLYQEPFVQPILLSGPELTYVRAVAHLADGSTTEDVVFVNAPDYLEEVEVQYVELHPLVVDNAGRPILGLGEEAFTVFEDGVQQQIRRFEYLDDLPIHAGLLLDTSSSMEGDLSRVTQAALTFVRDTVRPKDRACLLSFATQPRIEVRFTNDVDAVERAMAGLVAEGSTSLFDSLVYALTYFDGVKGQRALLLLSDGKDENSTFSYEQALEVARRSGVTVYAIGLKEAADEKSARKVLQELAAETGGEAFFLQNLSELDAIYDRIEEELRSRYLLTYQSTSDKDESEFRVIRVEVDQKGAEARTISGYYP